MRTDNNTTAGTLRAALIIGGLCALLWLLSDIVLLVFAAALLAVLLRGVAQRLADLTGLPVKPCLALVALIIVAALAGFGIVLGPRFINEGQQLAGEISTFVANMRAQYGHTSWGHLIVKSVSDGKLAALGPMAPRMVSVTFGTAGALLLTLVTALYLAISPQLYINGIIRLVPLGYRVRAMQTMQEIGHVLRYWMLGQLIDMAVVGIISTLGLWALHVPLPAALGLIAGLLTFIPYLGALLAGLPAVIVASTVGLDTVIWVVVLYAACHMIEGYIVAPVVSRRMVHLPPAITVLSMAILGLLYGFIGVLIATPFTAAAIVLVNNLYVRDILGDHTA